MVSKVMGWGRVLWLVAVLSMAFSSPWAALVPAIHDYTGGSAPLPQLISQTGLYQDMAARPREVSSGIIAFSVNTPLWSDGASKERYVDLPAGNTIIPTDSDGYTFPDKTVMVKNFYIDTVYGDSTTKVIIETRFLVHRKLTDGFGALRQRYYGFTYAWNKDQSDAVLVPTDSTRMVIVRNVSLNGQMMGKRWTYPSQGDCNLCHTGRRQYLGFVTQQLNMPIAALSGKNQLQDLFEKGILTLNPVAGKPTAHHWYSLKDQTATKEQRIRSYLAANCSHCHGNENITTLHILDYFNPLQDIRYYNDDPLKNHGGWVDKKAGPGKLIAPGHPDSSYFMQKVTTRPVSLVSMGTAGMPPLATFQIDSTMVELMRQWVCELGSVDPASPGCKLPVGTPDASMWASVSVFNSPLKNQAYIPGQRLEFDGRRLLIITGKNGGEQARDVGGKVIWTRPAPHMWFHQ